MTIPLHSRPLACVPSQSKVTQCLASKQHQCFEIPGYGGLRVTVPLSPVYASSSSHSEQFTSAPPHFLFALWRLWSVLCPSPKARLMRRTLFLA